MGKKSPTGGGSRAKANYSHPRDGAGTGATTPGTNAAAGHVYGQHVKGVGGKRKS